MRCRSPALTDADPHVRAQDHGDVIGAVAHGHAADHGLLGAHELASAGQDGDAIVDGSVS